MNYNESLLFYLVVGLAVAAAHVATGRSESVVRRLPAIVAACVFWPLYLPLLLSVRPTESAAPKRTADPRDDLAATIDQVERELEAALTSLDGWAENVLRRQPSRSSELRAALVAQADRIRQMEALVARERASPTPSDVALSGEAGLAHQRHSRAEQARADNMLRLASICRQSRADLLATLAWIRELVSMIHLAKFTGAPAARAEELVAQIAAAIESISSLSPAAPTNSQRKPAPLTTLDDALPQTPSELRT